MNKIPTSSENRMLLFGLLGCNVVRNSFVKLMIHLLSMEVSIDIGFLLIDIREIVCEIFIILITLAVKRDDK